MSIKSRKALVTCFFLSVSVFLHGCEQMPKMNNLAQETTTAISSDRNNWRLTEKKQRHENSVTQVTKTLSEQSGKTFPKPATLSPGEKVLAWNNHTKGEVFYRGFFRTNSVENLIAEIRPAKPNNWCGSTAMLDGFIELDPVDVDKAAIHQRNFLRSRSFVFGGFGEFITAAIATLCPQARNVTVRVFEYGFPDVINVRQYVHENGALHIKGNNIPQGKTINREEVVDIPSLDEKYLPGDIKAYQSAISRQKELLKTKAIEQFGFPRGKNLVGQIDRNACIRYMPDFIELEKSDMRDSVCSCFYIEMGERLLNGELLESGQGSLFEWHDRLPEEQKKLGKKLIPASEKIKKISSKTFRYCAQKYSGTERYKTKGSSSGYRQPF